MATDTLSIETLRKAARIAALSSLDAHERLVPASDVWNFLTGGEGWDFGLELGGLPEAMPAQFAELYETIGNELIYGRN